MRRTSLLTALGIAAALGGGMYAQAVPDIAFDSNADFLKTPENVFVGEVGGVGANSRGQVFVYTRTGHPVATLGDSRTFYHGGSKLFQFDQTGKFVRELGQDVYGFNAAAGLRIDPQDNIWTIDAGANQVVKFDSEGRIQLVLGRKPETIGVRPGGAIMGALANGPIEGREGAGAGAGAGAGRGGAAGRGAEPGATAPGAAAAGAGRAGAGAGRGGGRGAGAGAPPAGGAAPAGAPAAPAGGAPAAAAGGFGGRGGAAGAGTPGSSFSRPSDVAWDRAGNVFVADGMGNTNRIAKFDKDGKFLKHWGSTGAGPGQFSGIKSLATDAQGNLYVADRGNQRIQVFDSEGTFKSEFKNIGSPNAICVSRGATQYLYVAHVGDVVYGMDDATIYKVGLDGKVLGKFGTAGRMPKEFGVVNSIDCRTENELLLGEMTTWRVQKVTLRAGR